MSEDQLDAGRQKERRAGAILLCSASLACKAAPKPPRAHHDARAPPPRGPCARLCSGKQARPKLLARAPSRPMSRAPNAHHHHFSFHPLLSLSLPPPRRRPKLPARRCRCLCLCRCVCASASLPASLPGLLQSSTQSRPPARSCASSRAHRRTRPRAALRAAISSYSSMPPASLSTCPLLTRKTVAGPIPAAPSSESLSSSSASPSPPRTPGASLYGHSPSTAVLWGCQ